MFDPDKHIERKPRNREQLRRHNLTRVDLILQGKGMMHGVKSVNGYPGETGLPPGTFDVEQAKINKVLGYW
jgi:hypothetical protein